MPNITTIHAFTYTNLRCVLSTFCLFSATPASFKSDLGVPVV